MSRKMIHRSSITVLAIALLALGACSIAGAETASDATAHCEIRAETSGGMFGIKGALISDAALSGTYQLAISGKGPSGSSSVSQGGTFSAEAGETALGNAMVSDNGATYSVTLEIDAGGKRLTCADTIRSRI